MIPPSGSSPTKRSEVPSRFIEALIVFLTQQTAYLEKLQLPGGGEQADKASRNRTYRLESEGDYATGARRLWFRGEPRRRTPRPQVHGQDAVSHCSTSSPKHKSGRLCMKTKKKKVQPQRMLLAERHCGKPGITGLTDDVN